MTSAPARPDSLHGEAPRATGTPRSAAYQVCSVAHQVFGRVPGAGKAPPEGGR